MKSYSIIIVPSDHSGTRQYRISRTMLIVLSSLAAVLLLTLGVFAVTYGTILRDARRVADLELENEALRLQVDRVTLLSRELEDISGLRAQVIRLLGTEQLENAPELAEIGESGEFEPRDLADYQRFQELLAEASREPFAPRTWPASGSIRREFILQDTEDEPAHPGIAIGTGNNPSIRAAGRGKVIEATYTPATGHVVVIDHGYGFRTTYGNLDRVDVLPGQAVDQGQPIGRIDESGESSDRSERSSHMLAGALYFELRVDGTPVDPRTHLEPR